MLTDVEGDETPHRRRTVEDVEKKPCVLQLSSLSLAGGLGPSLSLSARNRSTGRSGASADRLDPVTLTVRVDEQHLHFGRRSSSAWAKNADAL